MIPSLAYFEYYNPYHRSCRIWLPLFLLWFVLLLLLPFILLVLLLVCLIWTINPFKVISVGWGILSALRGTSVNVDHQANHVRVQVY
jgi:hypothetical protein